MSWGDIRDAIRFRSGDLSARIWSDADLLLHLNSDVLPALTIESKATTKRVMLEYVDSQRSYTLPSDCYEVRGVKFNGKKLNGTKAYMLEELDRTYLNTTSNTPRWYYQEDTRTISFYPIPHTDGSFTTFTQELGEVVDIDDWTFTQELGAVVDIVDSTANTEFVFNQETGIVVALDDLGINLEVTYIYQPMTVTDDSDELDLPIYMQGAVIYGVLGAAFGHEGQGQNLFLSEYFESRFEEYKKQWHAAHLEWDAGQDQFPSQVPVGWGSDLDWRMRVWP